jgi:hypothetical protein
MKKGIITLLMLAFCAVFTVTGQTGSKSQVHTGKWKFEAPYAPEGFTSGTIDVKFADEKYTTSISFPASGYSLTGDKAKVEKDTLVFTDYVEGQEVVVHLKADSDQKMTGKAVYFEGEIPLTLTREEASN